MEVAKVEWSTRRVRLLAGPRVSNRFKVLSPDRYPPGPLASLETERSEHSAWRFATGCSISGHPTGSPRLSGTWESSAGRSMEIDQLAIYFQGIRRAEIAMLRHMEWAWSVCLQGTELERRNGSGLVSQIARSEEATQPTQNRSRLGHNLGGPATIDDDVCNLRRPAESKCKPFRFLSAPTPESNKTSAR